MKNSMKPTPRFLPDLATVESKMVVKWWEK